MFFLGGLGAFSSAMELPDFWSLCQASEIDSSVPGNFSLMFQELSLSHVNMYLQVLAGLLGLNGLECARISKRSQM